MAGTGPTRRQQHDTRLMHRPSFDMHREHRGIAAPGIAVSAEQRTFIPVPGWCTHTGVRQTKGREAGSTGAMLLLQRGRFGAARAVRQALETPSSLSSAASSAWCPPRCRGARENHPVVSERGEVCRWPRSTLRLLPHGDGRRTLRAFHPLSSCFGTGRARHNSLLPAHIQPAPPMHIRVRGPSERSARLGHKP